MFSIFIQPTVHLKPLLFTIFFLSLHSISLCAQSPILGNYPATTMISGQSTSVTPSAAPTNTAKAVAAAPANFAGVLSVNPATGVVTITNAQHAGVYTVTVTVFNAAGSSTTATFTLTVANPNCSLGNFSSAANVGTGATPVSTTIGDFNEDGMQDFVVVNQGSDNFSIFLGNGSGGFTLLSTVAVGDSPMSVAIGDFNGDGHQDLAIPIRTEDNVYIRLGDGLGGFSSTTSVAVGDAPNSVAIGDFNGDGHQDLAVPNVYDDNVSIRLGDGLGGFGGTTAIAVGDVPSFAAVGDFNGDSKQDLAVVNSVSNNVSILLGNGAGGFTNTGAVASGNRLFELVIGDFNEDGIQDLAVPNLGSDNVAIRLGDGLGGFGGTIMVTVGDAPYSASVGDFNGDGHQDLAVANSGNDNISVKLGDGLGGFGGTASVAVGDLPYYVAVGDFNGDGKQDLASTNLLGNNLSVRLGIAAEINVQGNALNIPDGDNTPAAADHTDFGVLTLDDTRVRTFTIQNTAAATEPLYISSIGSDNPRFAVSGITLPATLAVNSSVTFTVTFTPLTGGTQNATISIQSDDCDEAVYDFAVRIEVTCSNPTISCPVNQSANTAAGLCNVVVTYPDPTVTGSPAPTLAYTFNGATTSSGSGTGSGSTFHRGVTTVALTATNGCLPAVCSFTVTIMDNQNPTITCPTNIVRGTDANLCTAIATYEPMVSDNCSGVTTTATSGLASGSAFPKGTTTMVLQATDGSGRSATCSFTVTVNDTQLPDITCPANIVRNTDAGFCSAVVNYAAPTATDNCGSATVSLHSPAGTASGSVFPKGQTVVVWKATDAAMPTPNTATCSFTVTVNDMQLPDITCPVNIVRSTDANQCTAITTYAPAVSDNCPGVTTTATSGPASGSAFLKGTTTVVLQATDGSGGTATCFFMVTVNDTQNPDIICPANIVRSTDAGQCSAAVTYTSPTYSDNCPLDGPAGLDHISGGTSGSTFPKGTTSVIWQAADGSNNTRRCSFTVTVNDTQLPSITCPANQTVGNTTGSCGATVTYATPTYSDNCMGGGAALQSGLPSGGVFPKGQTTVIWRATDAVGLTRTCSFRVTVNDTEAPVITCPSSQSVSTSPSSCTANVTYATPTATDNCPGAVTVVRIGGPASGSSFPQGSTNVTWRAIDVAGRSSTCSFSVTVADATPPVVICPQSIAVTGSGTPCTAVVGYTSPTATDNCGVQSSFLLSGQPSGATFPAGETVNTWRAVDNAGLSHSCSFTVTVGCGANNEQGGVSREQSAPETSVDALHALAFSLAPNPAQDEVRVSIENLATTGGELAVYDAQGRLTRQQQVEPSVVSRQSGIAFSPSRFLTLSVLDFPAGVYFVTLRAADQMVTKRLVVSRM